MNVQLLDHVTLNTRHLDECIRFYSEVLGMENGPRPDFGFPGAWMYLEGRPVVHIMAMDNARGGTSGPIDHIAFSYENIAPELDRMKAAGVTIVQPIADRPDGVKSFFIAGPDAVSIEIVEAKPIPDGLWR